METPQEPGHCHGEEGHHGCCRDARAQRPALLEAQAGDAAPPAAAGDPGAGHRCCGRGHGHGCAASLPEGA